MNEREWLQRKKILEEIEIYLNRLMRKANLKIFKKIEEIEELETHIKKLIKLKYGTLIEIKLEFKNFNEITIKRFHIIEDNQI